MAQLINEAGLSANVDGVTEQATSRVTVELTDLWFEKTSDKTTWTDGQLTYTLEVKNNGTPGLTPPDPDLTQVVITDTIDTTYSTLIESSIATDPAAAYVSHTYNAATGALQIVLNDIAPGEVVKVTFQVDRVV